MTQIKLAWWREALASLDHRPAPAEPLLREAKLHLLPAGLHGSELATLVDGWEYLLAEPPLSAEDLKGYAERGSTLFRLSARLLDADMLDGLEDAGRGWALIDLARHSSDIREARAARDAAAAFLERAPVKWPVSLRMLGMLTVLARRDASSSDFEPLASPRRMIRMLAHRLTGR